MRLSTTIAVAWLAIVGLSVADESQASIKKHTDIPAERLGMALQTLAKDRNFQIVYVAEEVSSLRTQGAVGEFTPDEALKALLKGTGLTFRYLDEKTVTIVSVSSVSSTDTSGAVPATPSVQPPTSTNGDTKIEEGKKGFLDRFRLAQVAQGASSSSSSVERTAQASPKKSQELEEVVVTAQKKTENLLDVPVPVTAISAQTLVDSNQLRLQDYYSSIPGLSVTPGDFRGDPILTIRGITTGGSYITSTVGVVVDDIPYGSSTNESTGSESIDLDPSDLARVEVLRGPQGTLYGASSIGGLIKYVTVDPSTDALTGHLQVGTSSIYNAGQLGYNVSGAVNVPLNDTLAIRASAFSHQTPGYIDNVETGQRGVNKNEVDGGHLSALWRPSDVFSLKLGALLQEIKWDGSPYIQPQLGDLDQNSVKGTGAGTRMSQAYSATMTAKLGGANLTSLSGYSINNIDDSIDFSSIFGSVSQKLYSVAGAPDFERLKTTKFSQELRLSVPIGRSLDWLLGAFYTHENTPWSETTYAGPPATGVLLAPIYYDSIQTTYQEYAVFTDLTVHFTDSFSVQFGGRESQNRQTYMEEISGVSVPLFFGEQPPLVNPQEDTKDDSFTYLVTPQFKLSSDVMLYARLASGYRNGGPNTTAILFHLPLRFEPDTTRNYEIGAKGSALDGKLSFDASVYYIDWKDIQLQLNTPQGATYNANASRAKSQGVELSTEARPLSGMHISAWVAWNDAVLTQPFPSNSPAYGVTGDRLPYSSRFSGNVSVQQDFPLWGSATGYCQGAVSYVGDRESVFTSTPERQDLPAYAKIDLRTGVKSGTWTTNLFVDNVADRRGVLSGGFGSFLNFSPPAFTYIQPRTVGLSVSKTF